jgi:hypothetical protein
VHELSSGEGSKLKLHETHLININKFVGFGIQIISEFRYFKLWGRANERVFGKNSKI